MNPYTDRNLHPASPGATHSTQLQNNQFPPPPQWNTYQSFSQQPVHPIPHQPGAYYPSPPLAGDSHRQYHQPLYQQHPPAILPPHLLQNSPPKASQYQYQPLPPKSPAGGGPYFTRLVLLYPGEFSAPLHCTLEIVDVERAPPYEPLSYTWGRDPSRSDIYIDNTPLPIKPNLDAALRHVRLQAQSRRLWIDALCIDQGNVDERSRQVTYMREVYRHGARTVVWLGMPTPGVEVAFELTARLSAVNRSLRPSRGDAGVDARVSCAAGEIGEDDYRAVVRTTFEDFPPDAKDWLCELFKREYFERAWCIQEVVVCSWAIARCGELEMPFYDLLSGADEVAGYLKKDMEETPLSFWADLYHKKFNIKGRFFAGIGKDKIGPLRIVIVGMRKFKATDPRDKVYSILGVVNERMVVDRSSFPGGGPKLSRTNKLMLKGTNKLLKFMDEPPIDINLNTTVPFLPNYNMDLVEVYRMLAVFLVKQKPMTLGILTAVMHNGEPDPSWPSWIPKWNEPSLYSMFDFGIFQAGFRSDNFDYLPEPGDKALDGAKLNLNILSVDGFYVDRVEHVGEILSLEYSNIHLHYIWKQVFGGTSAPNYDHKYIDGDLLMNALFLTLVADGWGHWHTYCPDRVFPKMSAWKESHDMLQALFRNDIARFLLIEEIFSPLLTSDLNAQLLPNGQGRDVRNFVRAVRRTSNGRRVFITSGGMLGLGPSAIKVGDQVCVLFRARTPYILRRVQDYHILVGDAYVHNRDFMWGRWTDDVKLGKSSTPVATFNIH